MARDHRAPSPGAAPPEMNDGARLAIWTLRRIAEGPRLCFASDGDTLWDGAPGNDVSWGPRQDLQQDLHKVIPAVRIALAAVRRQGGGRLRLGCSGSLALTRHEQRLLRALAAAQNGDDERVDNCLYKIALERRTRERLATAVTALASALAAAGYWLPDEAAALALPAAALTVAELHGRTPRAGEVAWP